MLLAAGVGIAAAKHGQPDTPHNVWTSLFGTAITVTLLWAGGFFAVFS